MLLNLEVIEESPLDLRIKLPSPKQNFSYIDEFVNLFNKFEEVMKDRVEEKLKNKQGVVTLVFVNNAKIQEINAEHRNQNKPTDVISLAYLEEKSLLPVFETENCPELIVGDVFISLEVAEEQAKIKKHSLMNELKILFVHGLLHLFGFDHQNDEEEEEMEFWANKVLHV